MAATRAACSAAAAAGWSSVTGSHTRSPTSDQSFISSRVSRGDCAAAAISMWNRASARRRSVSVPVPAQPAGVLAQRGHVGGAAPARRPAGPPRRRPPPGDRRCPAARAGTSPAIRSRSCAVRASPGARMNDPPPRPRRVSTRPISRSDASASRRVTGDTPNCTASWLSAGSRSPSSSRPRLIAWASRRATVRGPAAGVQRREQGPRPDRWATSWSRHGSSHVYRS